MFTFSGRGRLLGIKILTHIIVIPVWQIFSYSTDVDFTYMTNYWAGSNSEYLIVGKFAGAFLWQLSGNLSIKTLANISHCVHMYRYVHDMW